MGRALDEDGLGRFGWFTYIYLGMDAFLFS